MKVITEKPNHIANEEFNIGNHNWDDPESLAISQTSMHNLFRTIAIERGTITYPLSYSTNQLNINNAELIDPLRKNQTITGEQFLNRRLYNDALLVMHKGQVIHESYRNGMTENDRHVLHSCTKSINAMLIFIAMDEGLLKRNDLISKYIEPFNNRAEWDSVTIQYVLDMQAGIEYSEDYTDPNAHYWHYARAAGYYPPLEGEEAIGAKAWMLENLNTRIHTPGAAFVYNSCLSNVLGMVLESIYQKNLGLILEEKLYSKIGAEHDGFMNTDPQGFPIIEGQFNLHLRDFARLAFPIISKGKNINGEQIINPDFIDQLFTPDEKAKNIYQAETIDNIFPSGQYHDQFWIVEPEQKQFTMLGIHGQFAWFDIDKDLMAVGFGSYPKQDSDLMMTCLKTLWRYLSDTYSE
ncbi:serine hydrolase domain-containing protein [Pseudemcibacter aquimaris]|uniref:serine hydrolase domain-containing protein n=1 Tax=Pseudemcibacter aquimaris TaxID=2857064 RepID=UPI0020110FA0|nr:serine hydrolase [Pseudemcibacter aquimaris]MCC3860598.1 beta-lactamase family protein [Pseudemcibacter aquimaris]WDU59419.1 beta-lactamase family protein [Pseudemcibacter aquimaris]